MLVSLLGWLNVSRRRDAPGFSTPIPSSHSLKLPFRRYDVIVVGLGGHGSATLYHLAQRGAKVLGLEQHSIAHDKGSSHGESRIIRLAYHEHPDYVPLLRRAYELWEDLQRKSGQDLLFDTQCIQAAPPDFNSGDNCFRNALRSAIEHNLPHEILEGKQVNDRFPGYSLPPNFQAVLAPGGILASERCIAAHVRLAQQSGAEVRVGEHVTSWHAPRGPGDVTVVTNRGTYRAGRVVFAAGAWMGALVPELQAVLTVERNVIGWFEVSQDGCCRREAFPVGVIEGDVGAFYQFPVFETPGMKIGKFDHLKEMVDDPAKLSRVITEADEQALRDGVAEWFPAANGKMIKAAACMFTNTQDHHFILDKHPNHPQVLLASPCSGHGYKFCSVIGEIMADLALEGASRHSINICKIKRSRPGFAKLLDSFQRSADAAKSKL